MTSSAKIAIAAIGFSICFYTWFIYPAMWLFYFVLLACILLVPTKPNPKSKKSQANVVQASAQHAPGQPLYDNAAIIQALEGKIVATKDEAVREGIRQALEEVRRLSLPAALPPNTNLVQELTPPTQNVNQGMSSEEQVTAKHQQELRNINIILYVASFLLVGAAALFIGIGTNLPETVKFVMLLTVAVIFYVVGLKVHASSVKLKPAAVAFVGTGLALVPFVGLAFYSYVLADGPLVWWLTSLIGVLAFWLAMIQIKTPVMSYFILAFVFSLATSTVSALHAPFVWYFVAIILTSSLLTYLSYKAPKWLPDQLVLPLEQNAQVAVPVAAIGSLLMAGTFTALDYTLISGIITLHYAINSLVYKASTARYAYWVLARISALVFGMSFTYFVTENWQWVAAALFVGASLLHLGAIFTIRRNPREEGWLWAVQPMLFIALLGWLDNMTQVSIGLVILGIVSMQQVYVMKRVEFSVAGIIAASILPWTLFRGAIEPAVAYEYIALILLVLITAILIARAVIDKFGIAYKNAATGLYAMFCLEALLFAALSGEATYFGWVAVIVAILGSAAAYIEKQPYVHIASNVLAVVGLYVLYDIVLGNYSWAILATSWTLGVVWYSLRWVFVQSSSKDLVRSDIMLFSSISLLVFAALTTFLSDQAALIAAVTGWAGMAIVGCEGYIRRQSALYEVALYGATIFAQRIVGYYYPDTNFLVYTHWWAITVGVGALLSIGKSKDQLLARSIVALILLSVPTAFYALSGGVEYRLLFLLEHVALVVAGGLANKKLAVQWGAVCVGLSLLWMLKGYTYLLLVALALGLIGFAIWRLSKKA